MMITLAEADKIVTASAQPLPAESVSVDNALGRVLACDVISDIDIPPFNKSAMDGFACRRT